MENFPLILREPKENSSNLTIDSPSRNVYNLASLMINAAKAI